MSQILISIMIPVFNQEKYIAKAIESALNQDYKNIEIVIGNDCSDDNTEQIIQSFLPNPQINYIKNKNRLGRVGNYHNLLYNCTKGDWIVNLDGDDYFSNSGFISSSIKLIELNQDRNIVFLQAGHHIVYENNDNEILKLPKIENEYQILNGETYVYNLYKNYHFSHLTTLYKRESAIKLNFYTSDILSTDLESLLRLAISGNVILVKKSFGKWLQHSSNASSTSGIEKLIHNLKWIENVGDFAINQSDNKTKWVNWKSENYKLELTGIFIHEANLKKHKSEKYKLLLYFWKKYKFLFLYPVFIKKTIELFLRR